MVNGHYQPLLVVVSILVGILASYTALSLVMRVRQARGRARYVWVTGGAMAMGSGIWAMHFVGMQAFRLPLPIGFDTTTTFVSWLLPVVASGLALWQVRHRTVRPRHLAAGALLMGLAINAMHYAGMASMQMHPAITYSPWLFGLSVAIAIGASALALQIGMRIRRGLARAARCNWWPASSWAARSPACITLAWPPHVSHRAVSVALHWWASIRITWRRW
jgi:NO-binding membrane sensor protein with MHYT domain